MLKKLLFALMIVTPAYAGQQVEIVTRFGPSTSSGRFAIEAMNMLNEMQKDYDFKVSVIIGANGEAADQRALVIGKKQPILLWNSSSSYTFNRYFVGNTYDRDNDLIPLQGMAGVPFSIQVAPDSPIETYEDFIKFVKSKPVVYMGNTASSSSVNLLKAILIKTNKIDNIKDLVYEKPFDITRAVLTKEADFTIFNPADVVGLKQLVTSSPDRTFKYRNVPVGKEVNMPDFIYTSQTLVSVPKEQKEFGEKIQPLLAKICYDQRFSDVVEKSNYFSSCLGPNGMKKRIIDEMKLIEKYKDSLDLTPGLK
jgi:tripartite-type tricarboxylate transporter receptor subunit TctC